MHLPSEMLNGAICPVTATCSVLAVAGASALLITHKEILPKASKFALTTAVVFGLQMLNYPIAEGISGHLIGGVLAASLLGAPAAMLSVALVLILQCFFFSDGGLDMLGANIFNMAILGAGLGGLLLGQFKKVMPKVPALGLASFASVLLAVSAVVVELACSGKLTASMTTSLFWTHGCLAVVEGIATIILASVCTLPVRKVSPLIGLCLLCMIAAPFASSSPDAFEWTMLRANVLPEVANFAAAPFADYEAFGSSFAAGIIGIVIAAIAGYAIMAGLSLRTAKQRS